MSNLLRATPIVLTAEERAELEGMSRSTKSEHRARFKARIVLMAAEGAATRAIGRALGCTTGTASKWRVRYAKDRLRGFSEVGDRGAEDRYDGETDRRILALLDAATPEGYANWTGPLIAKRLGDVHVQYVWRFLRAQKIDLSGRKSWCQSDDPEFAAKAAEIVGLYMAPPDNAIVLAVDEKPSIQALERAQGYLKLPNGRAIAGQSHDYKRHGTTTLFAALNVASGEVVGRHYKRRRRVEFLDFMNRVIAAYPEREIHVVLDNLSHPQTQPRHVAQAPQKSVFHYTPTHASWLSQIEIWFSILTGQSLSGASFTSVAQLVAHMTPSSPTTTKPPDPSSGPNPRSTRNASNHASRTNNSGY